MASQGYPETGAVFENTPVSVGLLVTMGILRTMAWWPISLDFLEFNTNSILIEGEYWRLLTSKLCFLEIRDLMTNLLLTFYLRGIERRLGTGRFVNHLIGHFLLTCWLEFSFMYALNKYFPDYLPSVLPSGPFFVAFPLVQWFITEFPPVSRSSRNSSEVPLITPLFLIVMVALDLMFAPTSDYLVIFSALLAGALFHDNFLCLQSIIRLPRSIFPVRPCMVSTRKIGATIEAQRSMHSEYLEQQMIFNSAVLRNPRNSVSPPEELITQLTEMGFQRDHAINALRANNNNVQLATNVLLNQ